MLLRADSGREISAPARPLLLLFPPSPLLGRSSLDLLSVNSPREPLCTCSPERSAVGSFRGCFFVCFPSSFDSGGLFSARGTPLLPLLVLVAALPFRSLPSFVSRLMRSPRAFCISLPSLLLVLALLTTLSGARVLLKSGVAAAIFTKSGDPTIGVLLSIPSTDLSAVKLTDDNKGPVGEEGIGSLLSLKLAWLNAPCRWLSGVAEFSS